MLKEMLKGRESNLEYKEISYGSEVIYNIEEMADRFNRYFVNSVNMLVNEDTSSKGIHDKKHRGNKLQGFSKIEDEQLCRVVRGLKNKVGTEEGITVEIIKYVVEVAGSKICNILNKAMEEGIFPNEWKEAIIIPIPKVRETIKINEFRPINKLPIYEKILEILVRKQLVQFLESNEIITECQSGFRDKHSCETALQWVIIER